MVGQFCHEGLVERLQHFLTFMSHTVVEQDFQKAAKSLFCR